MAGEKVRILIVNYEYPPIGGGGGVISRDLAEALVAGGDSVTVLTSQYGELPACESVEGVTVHRVPVLFRTKKDTASHLSMLSFVPSAIAKSGALYRVMPFDVVNTHFAIPTGPAGHRIARSRRVPNVLSIHGGDIFDPSKRLSPHRTPGLWRTVRAMVRKATAVVAQSSDTVGNTRKYYGITREIETIPLGIKPNPHPPGDRTALALPPTDLVLCTVGRLVKRKNLAGLLDILARLRSESPVRLLVIGDGPGRQELEARSHALGLTGLVTFTGRISEESKYAYLSVSDLYVSTAMHEGFGLVFLEAMECSLPVVCYDRGGQTDFLRDGVTGHVVALNDAAAFEQRLRELAVDPARRNRMGPITRSTSGSSIYVNAPRGMPPSSGA